MGWLQCRLSFLYVFGLTSVPPRLRYVVWDHRTATRHFESEPVGPGDESETENLQEDGVDAISNRNEHVIAVLMLRNSFHVFYNVFQNRMYVLLAK